MEEEIFEVGNVVNLKGNQSVDMVVESINVLQDVSCIWFDVNHNITCNTFNPKVLTQKY